MSDHRFEVQTLWELTGSGGNDFSRDHLIRFPGKTELRGSAAPSFSGNAANLNPEELFVASISSCQMLTYLYLCFKNRMTVKGYEDNAVGELVREGPGHLWMKRVTLKPVIRFQGAESQQARALAIRLIQEAHDGCFIAKSVKTTVDIEPNLLFL
ncbi:MAG: OsmC family protein [Leptospirales bacterium]|nr:OsmC family protein [Leptospirales bacterium]